MIVLREYEDFYNYRPHRALNTRRRYVNCRMASRIWISSGPAAIAPGA